MAQIDNAFPPITDTSAHESKSIDPLSVLPRPWKRVHIDVLLAFVMMIWGSTFLVTKEAILVVSPFTYLGYNFGLGALTLVLIFRRRLHHMTRNELLSGLVLGLLLFIGYSAQTLGLQFTTSSKAGFLTGLYTTLVPIFAVCLFRQKVKLGAILGFGLSLLGLILLSLNKDFNMVFGLGDILMIGCAVAFALHIVLLGKFAPHADAMNLAIVQLATTSFLSFLAATLRQQPLLPPAIPSVWGVILFMGILDIALCMAIINWAQQFVSSTHAALIYACEPVWAGLFGTLAGQFLSPFAWVGGACICLGMILGELPLALLGSGLKRARRRPVYVLTEEQLQET